MINPVSKGRSASSSRRARERVLPFRLHKTQTINNIVLIIMKKTIITLMALASAALGAETDVVQADFSVTDFSNYKTQTISGGGWTLNGTNSNVAAGESLVFTDDVLFVGYSGESLHNNDVVYTFVLSNLSTGAGKNALYTIHTNGYSGKNVIGLCLDSENSSNLTGVSANGQWSDNRNKDIAYPSSGAFTLTVAHTSGGTKVYIDGELQQTISGLQYTGADHTIDQLNFGNTSAGGNGVNVTLEGLYIHNQTLSDEQVAAFVRSIPEPTTATLSLLALAGLAARRRRK